jgi:HSP20 family protein
MSNDRDFNEDLRQNPMRQMNDFFQGKANRSLINSIDDYFVHHHNRRTVIPVEIIDTKTHFIVSAVLTGVPKSEIELDIVGEQLRISINQGDNSVDGVVTPNKKLKYQDRFINLPQGLNTKDMKATHRDGILEVKFTKRKGRKIDIE